MPISEVLRTEAGAHGRESRGLYRVHQFTKVEMFAFTLPEQSDAMHQELLQIECDLFDALEIPYHGSRIDQGRRSQLVLDHLLRVGKHAVHVGIVRAPHQLVHPDGVTVPHLVAAQEGRAYVAVALEVLLGCQRHILGEVREDRVVDLELEHPQGLDNPGAGIRAVVMADTADLRGRRP